VIGELADGAPLSCRLSLQHFLALPINREVKCYLGVLWVYFTAAETRQLDWSPPRLEALGVME